MESSYMSDINLFYIGSGGYRPCIFQIECISMHVLIEQNSLIQ